MVIAMQPTFYSYIRFLFGPFFRWWWALATGAASILSYLFAPPTGLALSGTAFALLVLLAVTGFFLTLSVVAQGWELFQNGNAGVRVSNIQKCKDFGGEFVFILAGPLPGGRGMLLEVKRAMGDLEAPLAILEVIDKTADGCYQAKPIAMAPVHKKDLADGKCRARDVVVYAFVDGDRVRGWMDQIRAAQV